MPKKRRSFLDPNTFLKTEQLIGGIDFLKMVQSSCYFRRWKRLSDHHGCSSKKIIEDTIVDEFSGLS
jgi:hypothetical protein